MIEDLSGAAELEVRVKRARMRAWRRGMRELDLILGGYVDRCGVNLGPDQVDALERLLARKDQDLYDWIADRPSSEPQGGTQAERAMIEDIRRNWKAPDALETESLKM